MELIFSSSNIPKVSLCRDFKYFVVNLDITGNCINVIFNT